MLFEPMFFIAGATTIALACLEKTLESFGYHTLGNVLKILIPIAALIAGVYFIETNALLRWLR